LVQTVESVKNLAPGPESNLFVNWCSVDHSLLQKMPSLLALLETTTTRAADTSVLLASSLLVQTTESVNQMEDGLAIDLIVNR